MINISIKTSGKSLKQLSIDANKFWFELQSGLMDIGEQTHAFMINFIKSHKKRPAGPKNVLEDAISYDFYTAGYKCGFAIGDTNKLNFEAPYWYAINYGSSALVGKIFYGYFFPGESRPDPSAFRQGRFIESKEFGKGFKMIPKKPIPPMNYIQESNHYLGRALSRMIAKTKVGKI